MELKNNQKTEKASTDYPKTKLKRKLILELNKVKSSMTEAQFNSLKD